MIFPFIIFFNSKATYHKRKSGQEVLLVKQAKGDLFRLKFWQGVSDEPSIWRPKVSQFSSVQSLSCVWLFVTPWTAEHHASLSITNSRSLPKLMSIESVMPCNHLHPLRPLIYLPSIFSSIKVFSIASVLCIRWPKYWSFSFSINLPMNTQDWSPLGWTVWITLQSQGLFKSLLQHHSSKASILHHSAFFIV